MQANLMLNEAVWPAMAAAFEKTRGPLAERMLAALEAGEAAGGDIRGKQSAAILIVKGTGSGKPWADRLMELRIEDHEAPLVELRRLMVLHRAYEHMNNGDLAVERNDAPAALREYAAAQALVPGNLEMRFWYAVALANMGKVAEARPVFREVFARDRSWLTLVPRLPASGTLTADPAVLKAILEGAPK